MKPSQVAATLPKLLSTTRTPFIWGDPGIGKSDILRSVAASLKLELIDSSSENVMSGIAFRMFEYNDHLKALNPLDICYTLEENTFNGNTNIQLMIRDIRKVEK